MSDEQAEPVDQTDWKAEHYKLQVRLDEHLAERQGVLDGHAAQLADLAAQFEKEKSAAKEWHDSELRHLAAKHEDAIAALKRQHAEELAAQAANIAKQHAAEIAKLKESVLVPAMADLHARQQADLEAKHKEAMTKLLG